MEKIENWGVENWFANNPSKEKVLKKRSMLAVKGLRIVSAPLSSIDFRQTFAPNGHLKISMNLEFRCNQYNDWKEQYDKFKRYRKWDW